MWRSGHPRHLSALCFPGCVYNMVGSSLSLQSLCMLLRSGAELCGKDSIKNEGARASYSVLH